MQPMMLWARSLESFRDSLRKVEATDRRLIQHCKSLLQHRHDTWAYGVLSDMDFPGFSAIDTLTSCCRMSPTITSVVVRLLSTRVGASARRRSFKTPDGDPRAAFAG